MAVGEKYTKWRISQVSWTDWTALDQYYGLEHSFIYSANINCDDELHGIKLSQQVWHTSSFGKCQLVSFWENGVMALPTETPWQPHLIKFNGSSFTSTAVGTTPYNPDNLDIIPWTVFQGDFWYGASLTVNSQTVIGLASIDIDSHGSASTLTYVPYDHVESTDDSIADKTTTTGQMDWQITAILNYNNTRLVVASWADVWVYYPELDITNPRSPYYDPNFTASDRGKTGWKKVMNYQTGVFIVWLTCTFEYLKVRVVDRWWNTKVYYYQGNNNLRDTFVYNVIDLTGEKVTRVYSINSVDYYISSVDWTDGYVNFNKMIGNVPVPLFKQRAGLTPMDINTKDPYFVWPCSTEAAYQMWAFYVADAYGIFKFNYTANSYDKGYMKWKLNSTAVQPYGLCICANFLYFSDENGCHAVRIYDTGKDWYQESWILISREMEGKEWGTYTKMLDSIRLAYEMNPNTNYNGSIDVYVSPNNLWESTNPVGDGSDWWYHVMHLSQTNAGTRTERSEALNNYINWMPSSFAFDWQTVNYAIKITRGSEETATPIVRQIDLNYHVKDKTNNVYDIN